MTRDEAVALIQEGLGFRTTLSSNIITHLQLAQETLEKAPTKPWFLISEDSYIDTTAAEQRLVIPTDFLEEPDQAVLRYIPDTLTDGEVDLVKDDYDVLRKNYFDSSTGTIETGEPEAYALQGAYFRIFPTPDDAYTLRMIYYAKADILDTNIENVWLEHIPLLLIGKAGKQIAASLRDKDALAIFAGYENEGRVLLHSQNIARDMANRDMQVGGPH